MLVPFAKSPLMTSGSRIELDVCREVYDPCGQALSLLQVGISTERAKESRATPDDSKMGRKDRERR